MISLIVPTRNRAYTLRKVLPSYFEQDGLDEIILVIDGGTDETEAVFADIGARYPDVRRRVVRHPDRRGASACRNIGVVEATNDYVLFCDDDEYLEPGYARTCYDLLISQKAGAVSGRRVYMQDGETPEGALERFGNGWNTRPPFSPVLCEIRNTARFEGELSLPFTNAIILTQRSLVMSFGFDTHYARGNGYREESDYQMNLYVNGYPILMSNNVHSIHLPISEVRSGGQRVKKFERVYWMIYYNNYFFDKYYDRYCSRMKLKTPKLAAKVIFGLFAVYREFFMPYVKKTRARFAGA
ncbi:putative glycosyltransferase EpsH [Hartmannibacter diazotrophicus]|uniref:Putative glycosyltransferase EpsH n=1 Tax=Hartmannibacter diazotrophicus TaxID=1482074 RepID=A0A2C9DCZ5_9HYPH|nr:glycosyltransferase family 2 protein [Hartmannibacter diazotrophicus]SON57998.1 putative glycosyltransferase EpsH [Hartmannibacter diazotrophicus]